MIIAEFDISVAFFHGKVRKVIYVVPPKDLRKKVKIWRLLKSLYGTRDASQVFATYVEEGLNDHGFQRNAVVPGLYWGGMLEALGVHSGDDFIVGIPDDRADDLEHLMREVFKVKICERISPGFLTSVDFLHRKVGWNAECVSWTHDPKHTLAMSDGFGVNNKKQLEQTKWKVTVAPGSKTAGKGLRDGADGLDEQETQQYRSLAGTALSVGQDRPDTQYATKEAARSWSFPYQEMPSEIRALTDANWAGELEGLRSTSCGWIYFGDHLLETFSSTQQIVALSTAESEYISITKGAAHALEVRSAVVEFGLTFNVICETDASAGRAKATRRGVGRVRHLDARLLWLQQLCAEGGGSSSSQAWRAQRGRPGNKDGRFETNNLAVERNTPSTANGLELMDGGGDSPRDCRGSKKDCCVPTWNVRNMCETSGFWICVGMVIVILMVLSGRPFANLIGQMTVVGRRRPTRSGLCVETYCV